MTRPASLDYQTPPPPPTPMSKTCCFAITWTFFSCPLLILAAKHFLIGDTGPVAIFLWRNGWARYALYLGPAIAGIFVAIKGVTDIDRGHPRDGRRLGMAAVYIGVAWVLFGAMMLR